MRKTIFDTANNAASLCQPTLVNFKKYVELKGVFPATVRANGCSGKLQDGEQCKLLDDALWVSIQEVQGWLENWKRGVYSA